jgi:hypothetical protein
MYKTWLKLMAMGATRFGSPTSLPPQLKTGCACAAWANDEPENKPTWLT